MKAAAVLCVMLSALTFEDLSAQTRLLPSSVGLDLGLGASFPTEVAPACAGGRPGVGGLRLGWRARPFLLVQATISVFGKAATASCGDAVPCLPNEPCLRAEGIGVDLKPLGGRVLLEPTGGKARVNPRFIVGVGRLLGDGENYALVGAGLRVGDRSGFSLTLEIERFFFHAPVDVFEHRTNEFLSNSRDAVTLEFCSHWLRMGILTTASAARVPACARGLALGC